MGCLVLYDLGHDLPRTHKGKLDAATPWAGQAFETQLSLTQSEAEIVLISKIIRRSG